MAFCSPPALGTRSFEGTNFAYRCRNRKLLLTCRRRNPQKVQAIALPPAPTLLLLSAASTHPLLPRSIRGPPASFLGAALLVNLALLPANSQCYSALIDIAPAAVCLFLFPQKEAAGLAKVDGVRSLIAAFLIGAAGTVIGAIVAGLFCPLSASLRWQVVAAFAATYIGGSINYLGVVQALKVPAEVAAAGMAADLIAMVFYFGGLFALATGVKGDGDGEGLAPESDATDYHGSRIRQLLLLVFPVALTVCIGFASRVLAYRYTLPSGADLLLMSTMAAILGRSRILRPYLRESGRVGDFTITVFFAALGASARFSAALTASPGVLGIALTVLAVHALFMGIVGRLCLRLPLRQLLLASNANIGGASTAAAFAAACGWRGLVPGAILVGTLGYLLGTPTGLTISAIADKMGFGL